MHRGVEEPARRPRGAPFGGQGLHEPGQRVVVGGGIGETRAVVSGEALYVARDQDALDLARMDCPTLRGTTLSRLRAGTGDTRGPVVMDLAVMYAALTELSQETWDPDLRPYEIVGCGESREITEVLGADGEVQHIEPKPGSEKAWVEIRLRDGSVARVAVPYTVPR